MIVGGDKFPRVDFAPAVGFCSRALYKRDGPRKTRPPSTRAVAGFGYLAGGLFSRCRLQRLFFLSGASICWDWSPLSSFLFFFHTPRRPGAPFSSGLLSARELRFKKFPCCREVFIPTGRFVICRGVVVPFNIYLSSSSLLCS